MKWINKINFTLVVTGIATAGAIALCLLMIFHTPAPLPTVATTTPTTVVVESEVTDTAVDVITLPEGTVSVALVLEPYEPEVLPELDAVFEDYYALALADITSLGNDAEVLMHARDLNQDGVREVIASMYSPIKCGARGCELAVYSVTDGDVSVLGEWANIPLEGIYALSTDTNSWGDLAFGPGSLGYGIFKMDSESKQYEHIGTAVQITP